MSSYDKVQALITEMTLHEQRVCAEMGNIERNAGWNPNTRMVPTAGPALTQWMNLMSLLNKHQEWGRKLQGIAAGYSREMQGATKHGLARERPVAFRNADLTVGTNEPFAKAVQYKHTISEETSAVDTMIAKAANQLTGESGEAPLPTQRKIIDMTIAEWNNWWPFNQSDFKGLNAEADLMDGIVPKEALLAKACERVGRALDNYKRNKTGLSPATVASLYHDMPQMQPAPMANFEKPPLAGPKSTALQPIGGSPADVLTVKITYTQPRPVANMQTGQREDLTRLVFAVYAQNGGLRVDYTG